ncbi:hypothetical protein MXB02_14160 [Pseudomonas mosselii]|uniref:hypothetical protein n=1 Tax=Pseudomonas mosselii TaxID=78327 RepID=UPI001FF9A45A|nr:hypothetical protein [Pseudomonas mosselii]UPF01744.1 hypothetical protein MXB02_14160 [Pseudomonas mosselii]
MIRKLDKEELAAWDAYYAAAITAISTPGAFRNSVDDDVKKAVAKAGEIADEMIDERRRRDADRR